jgi:hypothetical protein
MGITDTIVTALIIFGAAFYLYRHYKKSVSSASCGSCGSCGCDSGSAKSSCDLDETVKKIQNAGKA